MQVKETSTAELEKIVDEAFKACRDLLIIKGGEYAGDGDRLANFKRGASITGVKPLTVLLVYMSKHFDAFCTFARDQQIGKTRVRSESIKGRLHDLINYCLLALAVLEEQAPPAAPKSDLPEESLRLELQLVNGHTVVLDGPAANFPLEKGVVNTWCGERIEAYRRGSHGWVTL